MDNLVSNDTVRERAWFTGNTNISDDEIAWYITQAHWILLSYVSARYSIPDFTDAKFWDWSTTFSQAYKMMEKIESDLAVAYLLQQEYWIQELNEDNWADEKEWKAMTLLMRISEWEIRLIDIDGIEFALLPKSSNQTSKSPVVQNTDNPASFKKSDVR